MERLHLVLPVVLLIALALAILRLRNLLAIAILSGIYSLVMALIFTILDAVDVAFTEAAVGAGITLTLMLAALSLTTRYEARKAPETLRRSVALVVACTIAIALGYAMFSLPNLGDATAQIHEHVAPRYIAMAQADTGVPNIVTAVLASYRGYDTLGETTVIFTAGIAVLALLWRWRTERS